MDAAIVSPGGRLKKEFYIATLSSERSYYCAFLKKYQVTLDIQCKKISSHSHTDMAKEVDETGIEYKLFFDTFFVMKITGFWKPTTIKQPLLHVGYRLYGIFTSINVSLIIIESLAYIATSKGDFVESFAQNWYLPAIVSHTFYVGLNVRMKRKKILNLMKTKVMTERWTELRDAEEVKIIKSSEKTEQDIFRYWMSIVAANGFMNVLNPITSENLDNHLIFNTWEPCNTSVPTCFWICWTSQALSYANASITNVSCCCIVLNLIERVCSHVRILQHRLTLLPHLVNTGKLDTAEKERHYLIECILDHQNIYSTAKEINRLFNATISMYFVLNFSILCTNIYLLSKQPLFSNSFIAIGLFLCCMLTQALIHCWCGYKLTRINEDVSYTIFSMNWLELGKDTRKTLRFIMLSASKSIPLFDNFVVELSPESFLRMLKISYSAFNILQTQQ